ncbi:M14 family metallocarboxypeptidase [Glaciecola siphonariae]|uniref:M14 family metallocarboxypeptidase n=1 Tax=Glaciecola siphonariae TaxID=521012 RepID=A0ABV9LV93_9ALTE
MHTHYPIGTPGKPWTQDEKAIWRKQQSCSRSYRTEVLEKLYKLNHKLDLHHYGALNYNTQRYPLFALCTPKFKPSLPSVLITGGVHGYETSGVQGAILFMQDAIDRYTDHFNFIVAPCVSPWGYETINRWNPKAVDPNRSFFDNGPSDEANAIMAFVKPYQSRLLAHFDLHETTDTDNSEFRPALAARDGIVQDKWEIPDGFYTVGDSGRAKLDFQKAIIKSVQGVTHIAPPDKHGKLIGSDMVSDGVILYDKRSLHLCGGFTDAEYVTTTEVYPDSPKANPQQCNRAQVAAICGGLDYILSTQV